MNYKNEQKNTFEKPPYIELYMYVIKSLHIKIFTFILDDEDQLEGLDAERAVHKKRPKVKDDLSLPTAEVWAQIYII